MSGFGWSMLELTACTCGCMRLWVVGCGMWVVVWGRRGNRMCSRGLCKEAGRTWRWPLPVLPTSGITTALLPGFRAAAAAPLKRAMSDVVVVVVPAA
jgi:hypothetical protein